MRAHRLAGGVAVGVLASAGMILFAGCQPSPRVRYERKLADTGKPALHAVHTTRLVSLMRDIEQLTFRKMPQEIAGEYEKIERLEAAAEAARGVAESARYIPAALDEVRLPEEERRIFLSLADKLGTDAELLHRQAKERRVEAIPETMDRMLATCNACHTAFRVLPRAR